MKTFVYMLMGVLVVLSLSLGQAFAQQAPMAQDPMKSYEPTAGAAGAKGKELSGSHRGGEFMNKAVKNDKGENLGLVKDFVFDRDGELSYIVVSSAADADKMIPIGPRGRCFNVDLLRSNTAGCQH